MIDSVNSQVERLIELHKSLKNKYTAVVDEQKNLKKKVEEQNKLIEQLKEENGNLKIAKTVKLSENNADIKMKIEELVRDIDNCIGLLKK
ncbi:MAG: hypothetical protein JW731_14950 [Bacteroidales bacterium]|nr:hypothetical protein [Bacteroidales bacterium]